MKLIIEIELTEKAGESDPDDSGTVYERIAYEVLTRVVDNYTPREADPPELGVVVASDWRIES